MRPPNRAAPPAPASATRAAALLCRTPDKALVLITHYKRLLEYIAPDVVHVMRDGEIIKTGGMDIVEQLEVGGYATVA